MEIMESEIVELKSLLVEWEDANISDYDYCNKVGKIFGLGGWTYKGAKK